MYRLLTLVVIASSCSIGDSRMPIDGPHQVLVNPIPPPRSSNIQPLPAITVLPGKAERLYSGPLDMFDGLTRLTVQATPQTNNVALAAGFQIENVPNPSFFQGMSGTVDNRNLQLMPIRATLFMALRSRDRTTVFYANLGRVLDVNLSARNGDIFVQNWQSLDFPFGAAKQNAPLIVEAALRPATDTLPPLSWTYYLTTIVAGAVQPSPTIKYVPIPPGATRCIIPPYDATVVPTYQIAVEFGQWIDENTVALGNGSFALRTPDANGIFNFSIPPGVGAIAISTNGAGTVFPGIVTFEVAP